MIRNKISKYRKIRGRQIGRLYTKSDLARRIEVDRSVVTRWEQQKQQPSLKTALKIAAYFAVPVEDIFTLVRVPGKRK